MQLNSKKSVLFDLDGTLIDSIGLIVFCFQESFKRCIGIELPKEEILSKIGKPLRPQLEEMATHYNHPGMGQKILETYRELQFGNHDHMVTVFPGVIDTLSALHNSGIKLGIVTSKGRGGTDSALHLFDNAKDLFSVIITADDSKTHKPDAGPLLQAASLIDIDPKDCCYVGDTIFDMQASIAANMAPVGVLWGVANHDELSNYTNHIIKDLPFTDHLWRR
jgi:pyrophosphatase PpaX